MPKAGHTLAPGMADAYKKQQVGRLRGTSWAVGLTLLQIVAVASRFSSSVTMGAYPRSAAMCRGVQPS